MIDNMIDNDVSKYLGNATNETSLRSFRPLPRTADLFTGKYVNLIFTNNSFSYWKTYLSLSLIVSLKLNLFKTKSRFGCFESLDVLVIYLKMRNIESS